MPGVTANRDTRRASQSLAGWTCPYCKAADLKLRADGANECPACGGEVVTEYEWQRRQAAAGLPADPPPTEA